MSLHLMNIQQSGSAAGKKLDMRSQAYFKRLKLCLLGQD